MRYDTPVYFQCIHPGEYDPETGDYGKDRVTEKKRRAAVTEAGRDTVKIEYGDVREGVLTVRLPVPFREPFDYIRIGRRRYHADRDRNSITGQVFIVSEVQ